MIRVEKDSVYEDHWRRCIAFEKRRRVKRFLKNIEVGPFEGVVLFANLF